MCLKIDNKFKTRIEARAFTKTPLIAKRQITVYKILILGEGELTFSSPHRATSYRSGEEKKVSNFSFDIINVVGDWCIKINKGLHSYKDKELALATIYHYNEISHSNMYVIAECSIPKGTPYFKNTHEYVSLQLDLPSLSFNINEKKKTMTANDKWSFCKNKNHTIAITLPSFK